MPEWRNGAPFIVGKSAVSAVYIAGGDKVTNGNRQVDLWWIRQRYFHAGEPLLHHTIKITAITRKAISIITFFRIEANAIATDRETCAIGALRLSLTKRRTPIAHGHVLVVALFCALHQTIATVRGNAHIARNGTMRSLF
jgi:hypothetical protein